MRTMIKCCRATMVLLLTILALVNPFHFARANSQNSQFGPDMDAGADNEGDFLASLIMRADDEVVPDEYIVVMKPTFHVTQSRDSLGEEVTALGGEVLSVYDELLNGFAAKLPPKTLATLQRNPNVDFIEPNWVITLDDVEIAEDEIGLLSTQANATWGLDRVDQRSLPLDTFYRYDNLASNVHVYIIDTGLRTTHEEFAGRVLGGESFIDDGQGLADCYGHGTHVTGTIAGTTFGVAKEAWIHPVRVFGCSNTTSTKVILSALTWVINNLELPAVVNMSLGGPASQSLDLAVKNLIEQGVTVAVSAGNSGIDACEQSPARLPEAITVGGTNSNDVRSFNYGTCLDLFAPGVFITSAGIGSDTASVLMSGTSMASPHVAGAAALYLQNHPSATPAEVVAFITANATVGVVSNPGAGSPNLLLFTRMVPVPILPFGVIFESNPVFTWTNVANAEQYEIRLFEVEPETEVDIASFTPEACGQNTCSAFPGFPLKFSIGDYQWQVRIFADGAWGDWSAFLPFNLAATWFKYLPLFNR